MSDHFPIFLFLCNSFKKPEPKVVESHDFSEVNINKFKSTLENLS